MLACLLLFVAIVLLSSLRPSHAFSLLSALHPFLTDCCHIRLQRGAQRDRKRQAQRRSQYSRCITEIHHDSLTYNCRTIPFVFVARFAADCSLSLPLFFLRFSSSHQWWMMEQCCQTYPMLHQLQSFHFVVHDRVIIRKRSGSVKLRRRRTFFNFLPLACLRSLFEADKWNTAKLQVYACIGCCVERIETNSPSKLSMDIF